MKFKDNLTIASRYEAPAAELIEAVSSNVLCGSKKGQTEDFELEDYEF